MAKPTRISPNQPHSAEINQLWPSVHSLSRELPRFAEIQENGPKSTGKVIAETEAGVRGRSRRRREGRSRGDRSRGRCGGVEAGVALGAEAGVGAGPAVVAAGGTKGGDAEMVTGAEAVGPGGAEAAALETVRAFAGGAFAGRTALQGKPASHVGAKTGGGALPPEAEAAALAEAGALAGALPEAEAAALAEAAARRSSDRSHNAPPPDRRS